MTCLAGRKPVAVIVTAWLLSLLGLASLFVPSDMSFAALMDRREPEVQKGFDASNRYDLRGWLLSGTRTWMSPLVAAVLLFVLTLLDLDRPSLWSVYDAKHCS